MPDGLYKRLQAVKEHLNVSGVCQGAIEQAVLIEEIKMKDVPMMDKLIERLTLEKQQSGDEWKQCGIECGQTDAATLSYAEFREIETGNPLSEDLLDHLEAQLEDMDNPDRDPWIEGWREGVLSVWDQVKEHI